jgi:hypothetical protein
LRHSHILPQRRGNSTRRRLLPAGHRNAEAISEILEPQAALPRAAIESPDLPPDHPLEPGTRPTGRAASPSERIALRKRHQRDFAG